MRSVHPRPYTEFAAGAASHGMNAEIGAQAAQNTGCLRLLLRLALAAAFPQPVRGAGPVFGVGVAFGTQMLRALGRLHIGGVGTGIGDHFPQLLRVLQHGAGAQHVVIKGLPLVISHEDGRLEALQQCFFPDVAVGIVDEHTGVHIAVGIDVQIPASSGDTAAHILSVIWKSIPKIALVSRKWRI